MCDNEELVDLKAWACSVQGRAQTKNHPFLVKCLGRALCLANASTSRCERDFANLNMAFGKRAASPHLKELHVRVTDFIKSNPGLRDQVVERAGQIWKEGFGPQRTSGKHLTGNFVIGIMLQRKRAAT